MVIFIILIGLILMITAYSGTYAQLATELESDIPGYAKWALAMAAIVAVGFVPGLQKPARWFLGLVILVIVLTNWRALSAAVTAMFQGIGTPVQPNPATGAGTAGGAGSQSTSTYTYNFNPQYGASGQYTPGLSGQGVLPTAPQTGGSTGTW